MGRHGEVSYIVMELVPGTSVQTVLHERGALPWPQATRIIVEVCRGLAAAHAAGLIHRDIKPANILLGCDGCVKLTDFGLAKAPQLSPAPHTTHHGIILGTPHYMSPEQCAGETIDARADLYALGATYHALLTGRPPYQGEDTMQVMFAHCSAPIPDPRSRVPELPEACAVIVMRALAKQRADRFRSAQEMLAALTDVLATLPAEPALPAVAVPMPAPGAVLAENTVNEPPLVLTPPEPAAPRSRPFILALAALAIVAVVLVAAIPYLLPSRREETRSQPPDPESASIPRGTPITLKQRPLPGKHRGEARCLAFGGRRLASVGADGIARVWDLDDLNAPPRELEHPHELNCVALSPDGKWLATCKHTMGEVVSLWNVDTGKELGQIQKAGWPVSLAFHPSGRRLAIGAGSCVQLIDLDDDGKETGKRKELLEGSGGIWYVTGVAFTSDGKHLGATGYKPGAYFLDGSTLQKLDSFKVVPNDEELIAGLSFSSDGRRVALVRNAKKRQVQELLVWEPTTGQPLRLLTQEKLPEVISAVAFAPGDRQIAHGGTHGGPVKLYDLETGKSREYSTGKNGNLTGMAFSPEGGLFAATFSWGSVLLWDVLPAEEKDK
jgi:hypothetical protein